MEGQTIKGYVLEILIGSGGFGSVFRAQQPSVGRDVAVKVIHAEHANRPEFIRRFEREAQLVARLEHPFITPLYDFWREPDGAYLVMRYLPGGSLKERLAGGPLTPAGALQVVEMVAAALNTAHRRQVIHRDLKPSNLLLDDEDNVYLSDFGIAKSLDAADADLTETGAIIGSPDYLSPEQARSDRISPQTDIYNLGLLVYEMLAGRHPFPDATPVDRLMMHLNEPLPRLEGLPEPLAEPVNAVIQKATRKRPEERYTGALELAAALKKALGAERSRPASSLTLQHRAVLDQLALGRSNLEIAAALGLEAGDISSRLDEIFTGLEVHDRAQAVVRARALGLLSETPAATSLAAQETDNPYKGLHAFEAADQDDFFGRTAQLRTLLDRLGENTEFARFLAIVGPSGSGKSSLVKAGLLPALWQGALPGSARWYSAQILPGAHPLDELEVALTRVSAGPVTALREHLERDRRGLVRATQLVLPDDGSELLLVIDQFEELFTLVAEPKRQIQFLELIETTVSEPRGRLRVVITMRADFFDRPLQVPGFAELMQRRTETVLPLNPVELAQTMTGPAERVGVVFEEGLVAAIVSDVHGRPGALPLLQYALTELFEGREGRLLTRAAYERMGRVGGALAARAEKIHASLGEVDQALARQLFLRLVAVGEGALGTRRRATRVELREIASDPLQVDRVIDLFAAHRLLTLDHDPGTRSPTVEIAHESLLAEWARLADWLDGARADLRLQRQLAQAAREWEEGGLDPSFLLRGARLDQFAAWQGAATVALTASETQFLRESLAQREQQRALEAERRARETLLEQRALEQLSIGLAAQAVRELDGIFPERAVPLALEALEQYPYTWQAHNALGQAVLRSHLVRRIPTAGFVRSLHLTSDGRILWIGTSAGEVLAVDPETGRVLHTLTEGRPVIARFSPAEDLILTVGSGSHQLGVFDPRTGTLLWTVELESAVWWRQNRPWRPWSPDGGRIVTGHEDGRLRIWDGRTGNQLAESWIADETVRVHWLPADNLALIILFASGKAIGWDLAAGQARYEIAVDSPYSILGSCSSGGDLFVLGSRDHVQVVETRSGNIRTAFASPGAENSDARLSPNSRWLVSGGGGTGDVKLWSLEDRSLRSAIPGKQQIHGLSWSPDGRFVAVGCLGQFLIWDIESEMEPAKYKTLGEISELVWAPQGEWLAIGSDTMNDVLLYRVSTADLHVPGPAGGGGGSVAWLKGGTKFARVYGDGLVKVFDAQTGMEQLRVKSGDDWGQVTATPAGDQLLTANTDGRIARWDAETGERVFSIDGLDWVFISTASPDGRKISAYVQQSGFSGLILWDNETGEEFWRHENAGSHVGAIAWSPDGGRLAVTFGLSGTAALLDVETGRLTRWLLPAGKGGFAAAIGWSHKGDRLAVFLDGVGHILDGGSGEVLQRLPETFSTSWFLEWTRDDRFLLTADSSDGKLRVFEVETGSLVQEVEVGGWAVGRFSPDETRLLVSTNDGSTRIYPIWLKLEDLMAHAREHCYLRDLTAEEREVFGLPAIGGA